MRAGSSRHVHSRSPLSDAGLVEGWLEDKDLSLFGWAMWKSSLWTLRHWRGALAVLVFLVLATRLSLFVAVLLVGASAGIALTVWLRSKRAAEGGASGSVVELLRSGWAEHQLKRRLHKRWDGACEEAGLVSRRTKRAPRLTQVRTVGDGSFSAVVHAGRQGVIVPKLQAHTLDLAGGIGCEEVQVDDLGRGVGQVTFHWKDPLERILPLADLPLSPPGQIAYGIQSNHQPATIKMNLSLLVGGLTEFGKSNIIHALITDLIRKGIPTKLYISDPKGGMELREYGRMLDQTNGTITVAGYAKTEAESEKMLELVAKNMKARQYHYEQAGWRNWDPARQDPKRDGAVDPLVVVICDELLELPGTLKKGSESPLAQVVRLGRAVGYTAWVCTQVGQLDAVGRLRNFIPQRVSVATRDTQTTNTFLGDGAAAAGADCHKIRQPGRGYALNNSDRSPRAFRAALVTDSDVRAIAAGRLPAKVAARAMELANTTRNPGGHYTYVYRDDQDLPVYIGETNKPARRHREHLRSGAAWLEMARRDPETGEVAVPTYQWHTSVERAKAEEASLIRTWRPPGNTKHNPDAVAPATRWARVRVVRPRRDREKVAA